MKASEAAAEAIAVVAARHETCDFPGAKPCARCASLGAKALAVVMPDGRTVAQWLDDAEKDHARMLAQDAVLDELRAEVARLDAICWTLNQHTPTVVDAEFGFRLFGRACEHPSLTGDRCDACGWTEAWEADR